MIIQQYTMERATPLLRLMDDYDELNTLKFKY